ncbi:MAG: AraC family transcriptional regulator [Bacteroidales bacterium]|nr:AraC family transcriptional regulator [Bacteroidales bacterium]
MAKQAKIIQNIDLDMTGLADYFKGYSFNNEVMMIRVTDFNKELIAKAASGLVTNAYRLDALTAVLVIEGDLDVSIDYNRYSVPEKSLIIISPMNTITAADISTGGRFFMLNIKRELLDRLSSSGGPKPLPAKDLSDIYQRPHFELEEDSFNKINKSFENLYQYLKDNRKEIKEYLVIASLSIAMMEMFSLVSERKIISIQSKHVSRKKDLMTKFVFLLRDFGEKEHDPVFYADRLFISVQYLSLILKEETGKTASRLIAQHIATRARNMLRMPGATIKQTAEKLNFADQSSFGKFFRKETGITPKKYIESL